MDKSQEFECLKNIFKSNKILKNIPKVRRLDISTIIYTSGTSGKPKGVVLTHDSIIHNLEAAFEIFSQLKMKNERFISFLPLSHSYERVAGFFPFIN